MNEMGGFPPPPHEPGEIMFRERQAADPPPGQPRHGVDDGLAVTWGDHVTDAEYGE